jgi:nitrite reductase/ring-hydroxylating ferredoxin subunit
MDKKIFLCNTSDLGQNNFTNIWVEELRDEVIVFKNSNKLIKVISSICPHFGGEIFYNKKINKLKCKWHDWSFCPDSGKCLTFPIKAQLQIYDFTVEPDNLKIYNHINENNKIYLEI